MGNVSSDIDAVAAECSTLALVRLASTSHVCVLPSYRRLERATGKPLGGKGLENNSGVV